MINLSANKICIRIRRSVHEWSTDQLPNFPLLKTHLCFIIVALTYNYQPFATSSNILISIRTGGSHSREKSALYSEKTRERSPHEFSLGTSVASRGCRQRNAVAAEQIQLHLSDFPSKTGIRFGCAVFACAAVESERRESSCCFGSFAPLLG